MRISYKVDKNGKMYKYDLDSLTRIDDESYNIYQTGDGIFDAIKTVGKTVVSKLSGKTAIEIAKKAATKAVEKGSEAVGTKMGEIISNKLDSVFIKKPEIVSNKLDSVFIKKPEIVSNKLDSALIKKPENENKGYKIIEALKSHPLNKKYQQDTIKQTNIDDDIMKLEIEKTLQM